MYYKFTTEKVLNEKPDLIIVQRAIKTVLQKIGTDKIETIDNIVQFRNKYFLFSGKGRSGRDYMDFVTKGKLEKIDDINTVIKYKSYSAMWPFIIFFIFFAIAGVYAGLDFFFAGCFFLCVALLMTYIKISNGGKTLLNEVEKQIDNINNKR